MFLGAIGDGISVTVGVDVSVTTTVIGDGEPVDSAVSVAMFVSVVFMTGVLVGLSVWVGDISIVGIDVSVAPSRTKLLLLNTGLKEMFTIDQKTKVGKRNNAMPKIVRWERESNGFLYPLGFSYLRTNVRRTKYQDVISQA